MATNVINNASLRKELKGKTFNEKIEILSDKFNETISGLSLLI